MILKFAGQDVERRPPAGGRGGAAGEQGRAGERHGVAPPTADASGASLRTARLQAPINSELPQASSRRSSRNGARIWG